MTAWNMDRRRFLRMASMSAVAGAELATENAAAAASRNPPVIIIGAGMSGIAAAYWLKQYGISSLILEGRNRLGGRLYSSSYWPDAILDVGGAWIHHPPLNSLAPLAKSFNIGTHATNFIPQMYGLQNQLLPSIGPAPSVESIGKDYAKVFVAVDAIASALQKTGAPDQPLGPVVNNVLNSMAPWNPEELAGVQSLLDATVRGPTGAELQNLSLYYHDENQNIIYVGDLAFPNGYDQLVNALAKAAGQPIRLNCIVQQINYDDKGVTVVTNQGTFNAQYALITLPLGVLKKSQGPSPLVQFNPPLPDWKVGAINRLGIGLFDKLALRFPTNFWGQSQFFFHNTLQTSQFTSWFNPSPMFERKGRSGPSPAILVSLVFADFAKQLETAPNRKVVGMLMNILKPWFAAQGIQVPDPIQRGFLRSNWLSDPFAFGSYPNVPVGATPSDFDIMSLPVSLTPGPSQRLFFAGDATIRDHPSSANGAYDSGMREAYRLSLLLPPGNSRSQANGAGKQRFAAGKFAPASVWRAYNAGMKAAYRKATQTQTRGK